MRLRYLEALKHQEKLSDIKRGTRDIFRGCKTLSKCKVYVFRGKIERSLISLMSLEVKKQKAKNNWLFFRINCSKHCIHDLFRGWKCKQGEAIIFRGFKAPRRLWLIFLEATRHRDSCETRFYRLQNTS